MPGLLGVYYPGRTRAVPTVGRSTGLYRSATTFDRIRCKSVVFRASDRPVGSGVGRLALFVSGVLLVLLVAPTALQFAGVDVRDPGATGTERPVRLITLGAEAGAVDDGRTSVGAVRVVVTKTGGGQVDPSELTATWIGSGTYTLIAAGAEGEADGTFTAVPVDPDREDPILREHGDRAVLTFDLGGDDVDGAGEFAGRLGPGETATVSLTTPEGSTATAELAVPDPLPTDGSIAL